VKDDARGDAQVVLGLAARAEFVEARQEIIDLRGTNRKAVGYLHVDAATDGHSKRIIGSGERESVTAANMRNAEKYLAEGRDTRIAVVGNSRAEKISGKRAVNSSAEDVVAVIAAEISDSAEPVVCVVSNRCAATVQVKAVNARSGWILANVGVSGEHVKFWCVQRVRGGTKERNS